MLCHCDVGYVLYAYNVIICSVKSSDAMSYNVLSTIHYNIICFFHIILCHLNYLLQYHDRKIVEMEEW